MIVKRVIPTMASFNTLSRFSGTIVAHCTQQASKRCFSNNYARICVTNRPLYKRSYPTLFISPDGSSFTCRYHEPRQVVKLPMDVSTLTEEEKTKWLARRKPVKKVVYQDDVKSTFSSRQYIDIVKKKNK